MGYFLDVRQKPRKKTVFSSLLLSVVHKIYRLCENAQPLVVPKNACFLLIRSDFLSFSTHRVINPEKRKINPKW